VVFGREGVVLDLLGDFVDGRVGGCGDVAVDVAAGGQGGGEGLVDRLDEGADALLGDAVELEGLARGDAQGAVGEATGEFVVHEVLSGRDDAAGLSRADHHGVFLGDLALIAVVLLVDAVEFDELLVVTAETVGGRVGEGLADRPGKVGLFGLHDLVLGERLFGGFIHGVF